MYFCIKQPETEEAFKDYYQLRWKLLRAPWHQAPGSEVDAIEKSCMHLMAITAEQSGKEEVIGVARLQFNSATEAQIRYMAVAREHQRKGIGRELVHAMEQHAVASLSKNIVLEARETAVTFYEKLGYKVLYKSYLLFGEIQHFRMQKTL